MNTIVTDLYVDFFFFHCLSPHTEKSELKPLIKIYFILH